MPRSDVTIFYSSNAPTLAFVGGAQISGDSSAVSATGGTASPINVDITGVEMNALPGTVNAITDEDFVSDAVVWVDMGMTMGTVPGAFAGYFHLRTVATHINLHEDCTFNLDGGPHTVIYAHPTPNNNLAHRPDFLSSWTYTGLTGEMEVPTRDGGTEPCPVYYYSKVISNSFTWRWTISSIELQLSYYVGWFLFDGETTATRNYPEFYDVMDIDISSPYFPLAKDWWWDPSPATRPATSQTVGWGGLESAVSNAVSGEVIRLSDGNYNDQPVITFSNIHFSVENPVWIVGGNTTLTGGTGPGVTLRGASSFIFENCTGIRVWGFIDVEGTNNNGNERFDIDVDCKYISIENVFWNESSADKLFDTWTYIQLRGKYNRVSNCAVFNKNSRGNCFNCSTSSGTANSNNQFPLVQYNNCDGFNTIDPDVGWPGENNAFVKIGTSIVYDSRLHPMIRRNRFDNWHKVPNDAEWLVIKCNGATIYENVHVSNDLNDASTGFQVRHGAWAAIFGNSVFSKGNNSPTYGITAQGANDDRGLPQEYMDTNHVYGRHYVADFDGPNGFFQIDQIGVLGTGGSPANRWAGRKCLYAELYGYNSTDQMFRMRGVADPVTSTDIFIQSVAFESSQTLCDESYDSTQSIIWSNCVLDGSPLGLSPTPNGITLEDPNFFNRGDGVFISNHPDLVPTIKHCIPTSLQGDNIQNLGTTYTSI